MLMSSSPKTLNLFQWLVRWKWNINNVTEVNMIIAINNPEDLVFNSTGQMLDNQIKVTVDAITSQF